VKIIHYLFIAATLLPTIGYYQTAAPRIASHTTLDENNDQKITREEALKAGMPDATFKRIDKDNNGFISIAELNAYKAQNNSIAPIDSDKDNKISKAEAIKAGMTEREFRILDKDNSGFITQQEWDIGNWIIW
jgi:Ca2+-binding EF-hand superfamily protein